MTEDYLKEHLARRCALAAGFIAEPHRFKVCDQCSSIAVIYAPACRICGAYRFDECPKRVIEVSHQIAANPFPVTAGTVPRLSTNSS